MSQTVICISTTCPFNATYRYRIAVQHTPAEREIYDDQFHESTLELTDVWSVSWIKSQDLRAEIRGDVDELGRRKLFSVDEDRLGPSGWIVWRYMGRLQDKMFSSSADCIQSVMLVDPNLESNEK